MFTSLRLQNFKVWKDTGEIPLKPVTLLLGTNSSGKSSLIQSLLLLKQTVQSPDRSVHLNLGGDDINDLFNFGGFENVLNQGAEGAREFSIRFTFDPVPGLGIVQEEFKCAYRQNAAGGVAIQEWELGAEGIWIDEEDEAPQGPWKFRSLRRERGAYSLLVGDEQQPRAKGRHLAPERSIALSREAISALGSDGAVLEDLSWAARRELEGVVYLGPLRRKPERDYLWNKANPGEIGADGHRAIDVLLASALMKGEAQSRIIGGVSSWFERMKVADRLEVKQLGRSSRYEAVVHQGGVEANLRDVGIGISQVLPVLTLAYFAPQGSTIILEEPEIHLHPLAQSVLAELFVTVSRERKLQFIVETHSEHMFRRMQTLVARQEVGPNDTAMYFVERDGVSAKLRSLELDEFGRVHNWPEGFFGDALGETREQARLVFERMKKEKAQ